MHVSTQGCVLNLLTKQLINCGNFRRKIYIIYLRLFIRERGVWSTASSPTLTVFVLKLIYPTSFSNPYFQKNILPSLNKIVCDFKVKQTDAIKTVSKQLVDNFRIGHEQFLIFDFLLYTYHNESCEINKKYNFYKFFTVRDGPELGSGTSKKPGAGSQNARSWLSKCPELTPQKTWQHCCLKIPQKHGSKERGWYI